MLPTPTRIDLLRLREELGITARELAREMGAHRSYLHAIESGNRPLTPRLWRRAVAAARAIHRARTAAALRLLI